MARTIVIAFALSFATFSSAQTEPSCAWHGSALCRMPVPAAETSSIDSCEVADVLCCCRTYSGGECCTQVAKCGDKPPGCFCASPSVPRAQPFTVHDNWLSMRPRWIPLAAGFAGPRDHSLRNVPNVQSTSAGEQPSSNMRNHHDEPITLRAGTKAFRCSLLNRLMAASARSAFGSADFSASRPVSVNRTTYARASCLLRRRCKRSFLAIRRTSSAMVERSTPVFSTISV
jgi:hypothetical protein